MRDRAALITGASSGIGRELARLCARDQWPLVLVARHREELRRVAGEVEQAHGVTAKVLPADLSDPAAPQAIFDELARAGTEVEALVNNAGFATRGPFVETDLEEELRELQVDVVALTHLTKLFLRPMVARGSGKILNVSSTAAFQPGPLMAVYYASKAYVLWFSEALWDELRGTGVTVTCLCPGPTRTGFAARAGAERTPMFAGGAGDPAAVAEAGYRGLLAGRRVVVPGLMNQVGGWVAQAFPRRWVIAVTRKLNSDRRNR
jgi:short-subunit dehydrogenase